MKRTKKHARRAQKVRLKTKRAALRARIQQRRKKPKKKKGLWWKIILLILILLLLLRDCSCSRPPIEGPSSPALPEVTSTDTEPTVQRSERLPRRRRPTFKTPTPKPASWLPSFRLQVAARSPRLAECFIGTTKPGSLKWTTSVEPVHGKVSDHSIEPMLKSGDLTGAERDCILAVLANPAYTLRPDDEASTPTRVSLVIEF